MSKIHHLIVLVFCASIADVAMGAAMISMSGKPIVTNDGRICVVLKNTGDMNGTSTVEMQRAVAGALFRGGDIIEMPSQSGIIVPAFGSRTIWFPVPEGQWCFSFKVDSGRRKIFSYTTIPAVTVANAATGSANFGTDYPGTTTSIDITPSVIGAGWTLSGFPSMVNVSTLQDFNWTLTPPSGASSGTYGMLTVDISDNTTGENLGRIVTKAVVAPAVIQSGSITMAGTVDSTGDLGLSVTDMTGATVFGSVLVPFNSGDAVDFVRDELLSLWPDTNEPDLLDIGGGGTGIRVEHYPGSGSFRCFISDGATTSELFPGGSITVRGITFNASDMKGIPTVSEWGIAAMVLLVLVTGTIVFRRKTSPGMA